jgi:hypothetical protein
VHYTNPGPGESYSTFFSASCCILILYNTFSLGSYIVFLMNQASQGKRSSGENVVMVDPLEAKRLAAKQMQEIRAKEKLKVHCSCIGVYHSLD